MIATCFNLLGQDQLQLLTFLFVVLSIHNLETFSCDFSPHVCNQGVEAAEKLMDYRPPSQGDGLLSSTKLLLLVLRTELKAGYIFFHPSGNFQCTSKLTHFISTAKHPFARCLLEFFCMNFCEFPCLFSEHLWDLY